jgi:hypothetical protein
MALHVHTSPSQRTQRTAIFSIQRITGSLLIIQFVLMFATFFILGAAINWPASLGDPAEVILPLIITQANPVAIGYSSYFISALLLTPIALLVSWLGRTGPGQALLVVAAGLGVLASFAKLLGISRWLLLMPALAQRYVDPTASEATQAAISITFAAFNAYAGGVGELVGVVLLSGLWTLLVSVSLLRGSQLAPRWMGWFGLIAGISLLAALPETFGVDTGILVVIQGFIWQFWMLALGISLIRDEG